MHNFLNPKWLLIINTIPLAIILSVFFGEYQIINSLLNDDSKWLWGMFGYTLTVLTILNLIYTIWLIHKNKNVSYIYAIIAILSYIPYLYLYSMYSRKLLPFTIPQWMVSDNILLYVGTFLMPTLIYSLFILVIHFTPKEKDQPAWKSFIIAILIPCLWYIFFQIILPFWQPLNSNFSQHTIILFIIVATLVFLFFLMRGIFILVLKKSKALDKYQLLWKVPIAIIFPLLGLALNNGHLNTFLSFGSGGIFGDFSHYWFYVLATLNGIFICLPNLEHKNYRLMLFAARSFTFTYTLYFFLVFLPYLPLSILAIIAFGAGFLMLTPLVLFIIHINELVSDYRFLQLKYSPKITSLIPTFCLLVIPALVTTSYLNDRFILNESLDYLYTPNYSKNYSIDKSSLSRTINIIKEHKNKSRKGLFGNQTPFLSSYFNWLVLDNLTLSNSKINTIENVFFAKNKVKRHFNRNTVKDVKISKINSTSKFNKKTNSWVSWVNLELTNKSTHSGLSEYATKIELPTGSWISDYYLYVGDKKEMGILAEKKSAMFVYSQIRNERKDPGILYYLTRNKVAFRVFPFSKKETRKTGIEIIHDKPIKLNIDNHTVSLGSSTKHIVNNIKNIPNRNVLFISSEEKSKLSKIYRKPYYHFIIDTSQGKNKYNKFFIKRINNLLSKNHIHNENAKITFANTFTSTYKMDENWEEKYNQQVFSGGFYLDRAIKKALFDSHKKNETAYPVIIVVTDDIKKAIIKNDFYDFKIAYPENNFFYNLNYKVNLIPHSLIKNSIKPASKTPIVKFKHSVIAYPNISKPIGYLPDTGTSSIVMVNDVFEIQDIELKEKSWNSALLLQGKWISHVLHPEISDDEWLSFVRQSFIAKILTPVTSYIVVENEAQKAFLRKKQEKVLSSNKSLDLSDDVDNMTEPNLFLLAILLGIILYLKNKKTCCYKTKSNGNQFI